MTNKFYIDAHVHFFSAGHIPLQQTFDRVLNKVAGTTGKKLKASASLAAATPLVPLLPFLIDNKSDKIKAFLEFFDTTASYSINKAVQSSEGIDFIDDYSNRIKLFTPLIMDFEHSILDYNPSYVGQKLLSDQVLDLESQAKSTHIKDALLENKWLILPFLGLDLRRFTDKENIDNELDDLISTHSSGIKIIALSEFDKPTNYLYETYNGYCIGIKLYPSLGCDIWPEDEERQDINVALIKELATRELPVTVHCQKDSYESGDLEIDDTTLINYANPNKWDKLLTKAGNPKVFLNFAHFGGEEGVKRLVNWRSWKNGDGNTLKNKKFFSAFDNDTKAWTYMIIKLIKTQKNLYSDLAAFNFEDGKAVASLLWLIYLDDEGLLDQEFEGSIYKLRDKLLFGTDIPMTMYQYPEYKSQVKDFIKCMSGDFTNKFMFVLPPSSWFEHDSTELIENLIDNNPVKFLFEREI